jgi:UDP-N-acetylmuramoyl-tripeptide--D-alanyl-D-alanine ligase
MHDVKWISSWVAQALQACLSEPAPEFNDVFSDICTDSRKVGLGGLFFCLRGERFDAHDFAEDVRQAGAFALVVERRLPIDMPQYVVRDTRLAFGALAAAWRMQFDLKVLAVVGSNGKTTSKEMLARVCQAHYGVEHVLVTAGNLNNDIGVPQTLLKLRAEHRVAVIEMGMNHPGEIDYLAGLVKPDVVLLTNAQREHQEFMKTVEAVAQENGSAFLHLKKGGCAVFPANTAFDAIWVEQAQGQACVRFGVGGTCYFEPRAIATRDAVLNMSIGSVTIHPTFLGAHNFDNASGAAAAAWAGGCSLESIQRGLEQFKPVSGRLEIAFQSDRLLVINDAYNANPDSVNAASQVLAAQGGNTLLVLGDMGEVGDQSDQYHAEVGVTAKALGLGGLFALGNATQHTVAAFGLGARHFQQIEELVQQIIQTIKEGQWTVLVKGSRFMKMERVVLALTEHLTLSQEKSTHAS